MIDCSLLTPLNTSSVPPYDMFIFGDYIKQCHPSLFLSSLFFISSLFSTSPSLSLYLSCSSTSTSPPLSLPLCLRDFLFCSARIVLFSHPEANSAGRIPPTTVGSATQLFDSAPVLTTTRKSFYKLVLLTDDRRNGHLLAHPSFIVPPLPPLEDAAMRPSS